MLDFLLSVKLQQATITICRAVRCSDQSSKSVAHRFVFGVSEIKERPEMTARLMVATTPSRQGYELSR